MSVILSPFAPLLAAHFLTFLNSNFLKNALILLVLANMSQSAAEAMSAFVSATFMLPMIFVSGIGGRLADVMDRRRLARWLKAGELGAVSVAVAGVLVSNFWLVLLGLILMQVVGALFGPVRGSLIPDLAGHDRVPEANAWIEAAGFIAMVTGVWLVGIAFTQEVFVRDVVAVSVLVLSAASFAAINFVQSDRRPTHASVELNVIRSTVTVLRQVASNRGTFSIALALGWGWFVSSLLLSTGPAFVQSLGGTVSEVSTGILIYGVLGVVGAQLAAKACKHFQGRLIATLGLFVMSCSIASIAFADMVYDMGAFQLPMWSAVVGMGVCSLAFGFVLIPLASAIQLSPPRDRRAQTVAGSNVLNALLMVAGGYLVSAARWSGVELNTIYLSTAAVTLVVGLRMLRTEGAVQPI